MRKFSPETPNPFKGVNFIWPNEAKIEDISIEIGENVTFRPPCTIYWGCKIGDNCSINHYTVIREKTIIGKFSKIGNGTTLDGNITIGDNVSIHTNCFIPNNTIIEDYVFIGPSNTITNTKKIKHGRKFPLKEDPTLIKFGARIGGNCTILPNITIGKEALIGAGSLITNDIPDYKISFGVPAKIMGDVPKDEYL